MLIWYGLTRYGNENKTINIPFKTIWHLVLILSSKTFFKQNYYMMAYIAASAPWNCQTHVAVWISQFNGEKDTQGSQWPVSRIREIWSFVLHCF